MVQFCKKLKLTWLAGYGHSWEVNVNVNMLYQLPTLALFCKNHEHAELAGWLILFLESNCISKHAIPASNFVTVEKSLRKLT